MRVIGRLLRWACWLGAILLAVTAAAVMYLSHANLERHGSGHSLDEPVDALLVLGGRVDGDGQIGFSSRRRVRVAVALQQAGRAKWLILSGGSPYPGASAKTADLMRDFALGLGAPPDRILLEAGSASTFENLRFGFSLAAARGLGRIAIVTDAFHIERSFRLAGYFGHPEVGLVAVEGLGRDSPGNRVWSILREALAWWYNLAKMAGWEALDAAGFSAAERGALIR